MQAPQRLGSPAIAQEYKVHQNASFEKKILKTFFPKGPMRMFPWAPLWLSMGLALRCVLVQL